VRGYNFNKATKEFDNWAISAVFAFMEGYKDIYYHYYLNPLKKLLEANICVPEKEFITDINSSNWKTVRKKTWDNWWNSVVLLYNPVS